MEPALMLCTLVDEPFDGKDWIFEPKFDGLRVLARFDGKRLELWSRNGKLQNGYFPEIVEGLGRSLRPGVPVEADGELVSLDERGQSSFRLLQQRFHVEDPEEVRARMERYPATLYLFDLLEAEGRDLRGLQLIERKRLLWRAVRWNSRIRMAESIDCEGRELFAEACKRAGEGIVAKRKASPYVAARTGDWLKIKCLGRQELVIGGFTDPQRSRVGLGALLAGYYESGRLIYAGKVGTGFTKEELLDLRERLGKITRRTSPFYQGAPSEPGTHWVEPKLVAEIAFAEWTQNGLLRQPRYEGLRQDKAAQDVRKEIPWHSRNTGKSETSRKRASPGQKRSPKRNHRTS